jgi:hypothetical protein
MANAGLAAQFIIYDQQFWGGVVETLQRNTEAFNAASNGVLRLNTRAILGDFERESFLKNTASLVSFRDITSNAALTDSNLAQGEFVGVKVNRTIGPVLQSRDSFRKIGLDPVEYSFLLGQQIGPSIALDYIDTGVGSVRAAIANQAALQYSAVADSNQTVKTLSHTSMVSGMALFGDRAARLKAIVTHSKNYFDLMKQQIADKLFEVAGATVYNGTIASFGKPVVVIDSPTLFTPAVSGSNPEPAMYDVLMLVDGAVEVAESEERDIIAQPVTGQSNLADRIQGEYAFNVRVKGCHYDTTQGAGPQNSVLYTPATWIKAVSDNKEMPGVRVTVE